MKGGLESPTLPAEARSTSNGGSARPAESPENLGAVHDALRRGASAVTRRLANTILAIFVCASSAILLLNVLCGEDVSQLIDPNGRLRGSASHFYLYGIPALWLTVLLACLRLPDKRRADAAAAVCSLTASLYLAEVVLHVRYPPPVPLPARRAIAARKAGVPFDMRTKIEMIEAYESQGIDLIVLFNPELDQTVPLGTVSDAWVMLNCMEGGTHVIFETDEHGFRNPKGLHRRRLDVAILGDSFAMGACVGSEASAADVVRRVYPKTLSLGVGGNGPLRSLASLAEFAAPRRPRVVFWLFFEGNDLRDFEREQRSDLLKKYVSDDSFSQKLARNQAQIDSELRGAWGQVWRGRQLEKAQTLRQQRKRIEEELTAKQGLLRILLLDHIQARVVEALFPANETRWTLSQLRQEVEPSFDRHAFRSVLQRAQSITSSWGGSFAFVYLPSYYRFSAPRRSNPHREEILEVVRQLKIPIVDMYPRFRAEANPLSLFPFGLPGHYNEAGHQLLGKALLEFMEDHRLIAVRD
jgi:hypothetical protein